MRPGFQIVARFLGVEIICTYRTSNVNVIYNRELGGSLATAQVEGRELAAEGIGCSPGELSGTSTTLTVLNATTRITLTLI